MSAEDFASVQAVMTSRQRGRQRKPQAKSRFHLLRGQAVYGICGHRMESRWIRHETYYQYRYRLEYTASPVFTHPKNVYLRELHVLPAIDEGLSDLFSREHIGHTCAVLADTALAENGRDAEIEMAERSLTACRQKLARDRALLDEGVEPGVVASWIGGVTVERTLIETRLRDLERTRPVLSAAEIEETVLALGGLTDVLEGPADGLS